MTVVRFERVGSLGHIILCDPPLNLIGASFNECLKQAVHEAFESDIRALLIRAEGPNFSKGGDVAAFLKLSTETFRTFISEIHNSYRAIESMPIPTVAAVRGAAFGGAFELALACDFIVAADNAVFQSIEASVGSAPLCGAVQRVAERAGRARAVRYMMLSEPMTRPSRRRDWCCSFREAGSRAWKPRHWHWRSGSQTARRDPMLRSARCSRRGPAAASQQRIPYCSMSPCRSIAARMRGADARPE